MVLHHRCHSVLSLRRGHRHFFRTVQVLGECKTPKDAKIAPCRPPAARKSFTLLRRVSVISRARIIQLLKLPDHPLEGDDVLGRGAQRGSLGRRHYSGVHYSGCLSSVHAGSRRGCTIVIYSLQFLCCCGYFAPSREPLHGSAGLFNCESVEKQKELVRGFDFCTKKAKDRTHSIETRTHTHRGVVDDTRSRARMRTYGATLPHLMTHAPSPPALRHSRVFAFNAAFSSVRFQSISPTTA